MSYQKHNYVDGTVLHAAPLNEMDNQIAANEAQIEETVTNLDRKYDDITKHGYAFEDGIISPRVTSFFEKVDNLADSSKSTVSARVSNTSNSQRTYKNGYTASSTSSANALYIDVKLPSTGTYYFSWVSNNVSAISVRYQDGSNNSLATGAIPNGSVTFTATKVDIMLRFGFDPYTTMSVENILLIPADQKERLLYSVMPNEVTNLVGKWTDSEWNKYKSLAQNGSLIDKWTDSEYSTYKNISDFWTPDEIKSYKWGTRLMNFQGDKIVWASYGDSMTAAGATSDDSESTSANQYQKYVRAGLGLGQSYVRGVGGQRYIWNEDTWFADSAGRYCGRTGAGDTIQPGQSESLGCFSSWDRITKSFPNTTINNRIRLIILLGGTNDFLSNVAASTLDNDVEFITDSTYVLDTAWKNSEFYSNIGGDYNVSTLKGAVASTIMKLQVRCPNATIVVCTPYPMYDATTKQPRKFGGITTRDISNAILDAAQYMCVPTIDVNATCSVNRASFSTASSSSFGKYFNTDRIHPTASGYRQIASSIIAGLQTVVPVLPSNYAD